MNTQLIKQVIAGSIQFTENHIKKIRAEFTEVEEHIFYGDEPLSEDLFNLLYTKSVFYDNRLIIVNRVEAIKNRQDFFNALIKTNTTNVVLVTNDIKKGEALKKNLAAIFTFTVEGRQSSFNQARSIISFFESEGLPISPSTAHEIGISMDWNMQAIRNEAEKLGFYFLKNKPKNDQELLYIMDKTASQNIFDFINSFMRRSRKECMNIFISLPKESGSTLQLINMLNLYLFSLYFKLTNAKLNTPKNPLFGGKSYFLKTVDSCFKKWNKKDVEKAISKLRVLDFYIKTGRTSPENALITLTEIL